MRINSEASYHWPRIISAFDYQCAYCGSVTVLYEEHMMPRCRGGDNSIENVVPSCQSCNSRKGSLTPLEWFLLQLGWFRRAKRPHHGVVLGKEIAA